MISWKRYFFCLSINLVSLLLSVEVRGQRYPVSGSLVVSAPSSSMAEYASGLDGSIALSLVLNDHNVLRQAVRLRLTVRQGSRVLAQSLEDLSDETPLILQGGIPEVVARPVIGYYFRQANLLWQSERAYEEPMAESLTQPYTFSFEVLDYTTLRPLSAPISTLVQVFYNESPGLYLPEDKATLKVSDGPPFFQWINTTQQASRTEYRLVLKEITDPDDQNAYRFQALAPYYSSPLQRGTTLLYDPGSNSDQPPLVPGVTYGWQVQALAEPGTEAAVVYRQEGLSAIRYFTYQPNCPLIDNPTIEAKSANRIVVSWRPLSEHSAYFIAHRKQGTDAWFYSEALREPRYNFTNLEAATTYEFRIGGACLLAQRQVSVSSQQVEAGQLLGHIVPYSHPRQGHTLSEGELPDIVCGQAPTIELANQELIEQLQAGDEVKAGDFLVTLTRVSGSKGGWSGEGYTLVRPFGDTRWAVDFAQIQVNTDKQLLKGAFLTRYDATDNELVEVDNWIDAAKELYQEYFDEDYKQIKALAEVLSKEVMLHLPKPLQETMDAAVKEWEEADQAYKKAIEEYENTTEGPPKEEAKKMLNEAKLRFKEAEKKLKAAKELFDQFIDLFQELIKKAAGQIYEEAKKEVDKTCEEIRKELNVLDRKDRTENNETKHDQEQGMVIKEIKNPGVLIDVFPFQTNEKVDEKTIERAQKVWDCNMRTMAIRWYNSLKTKEGMESCINKLKEKSATLADRIYQAQKEREKQEATIKEVKTIMVTTITENTQKEVYKKG